MTRRSAITCSFVRCEHVARPGERPNLFTRSAEDTRELCLGETALRWAGAATHGRGTTVEVVLDGRIDNREDLARDFGIADRRSSDADLVARAYEVSGLDFAARLLGDFALMLWDRARRRLVCARDVVGARPLYYSVRDDRLLSASELGLFLADPAGRPGINEAVAAEYLACNISTMSETLYRGVMRLPPAHLLIADQSGHRVQRFWDPTHVPDVRHPTDLEYSDHLRDLLTAAVRARLAGAARPGVLLSGGVDSSSVALIAAASQRDAGGVRPTAVSAVFPGRRCDESAYVDAVGRAAGLTTVRVEPPVLTREALDANAAVFADFPGYPNAALMDAARRAARERSVDVLLTGEGGDEWLAGSYYRYADLVSRGRLFELARAWRADRRFTGPDSVELPAFSLLRVGLWPNVPRGVKRVYRRVRGRTDARPPVPEWIAPEFAARVDLRERLRVGFVRGRGESFSRAHTRSALDRAVDVHYFELMERSASRYGVDERHPFHDRRIIEFALGIPDEQRWGSEPKAVLRRAVAGLVPEVVRTRTTKAYFQHAYGEALCAAGGEAIVDTLHPWLAERVIRPHVRAMFAGVAARYARGDERYTEHIWPCWMIYGLDRWLRAVIDRPARPEGSFHA